MKTLLTSILVASTLIYAANVAAADVCPSVKAIHQNAFLLDSVHHEGNVLPKRYQDLLSYGDVYSSKQFISEKIKWDLTGGVDLNDEGLSDDWKLQQAQMIASKVSELSQQVHGKEKGKFELHMCAYTIADDYSSYPVIAFSLKGKLPKEMNAAVNKIALKK